MFYSKIHDAPLEQLIRWWNEPELLSNDLSINEALDEVAYGLSNHAGDGVEVLKRSLNDQDVNRREYRRVGSAHHRSAGTT